MKAALDAHYEKDHASAACVVFNNWTDQEPSDAVQVVVPGPLPYRAGRFYQRELPCLTAVLQKAGREFEAIVIDGYVHLKAEAGKGLGIHLFESLSYATMIIGVAKARLAIADRYAPILRGRSRRPLFVSAVGCSVDHAVRCISRMHGPYRIPTLLKLADGYAGKKFEG